MIYKKGQVAIWVIIGLVLVASVVIFFLLRGEITPTTDAGGERDPRGFIDNCVRKNVNDIVDEILPHGGFLGPGHSKIYDDVEIEYLCYSANFRELCVNEHPVYLQEVEEEIERLLEPRVKECFRDYKFEIESREFEYSSGEMELDISLGIGKVYVDIDRDITVKKNDRVANYNRFEVEVINPIYDLARVASRIVNSESLTCDFDNANYMILFPEHKIERFLMSDSTKIYTILDRGSGKELKIAIRGCAIEPGL